MKQLISKTIWISAILLGFMTTMAPVPIEAKVTKGQASIAKRSANLYLKQRQYDKALEQYLVAAEGRPDDLEVQFSIGTIYSRKELYDEMNKHFAIIEGAKKNKKWLKRIDSERKTLWRQHYNIGVQALNAKRNDYAIEQFNIAIKVDERESDAYEGVGIAYLNTGKTEEGIQAYRNAIEKNPKKSQSYYNLSVALTNQRTLESQKEALYLLQKGHELAPKDLQILQQMALLFNRQGDNKSAGEAAEKALAVDPKNPTVLNIASQIFLTAEDFAKSAEVLEKVIEITPDDQNALFNLAIAYSKMGESEKAIDLYKKTVEATPDDADAWYQLGSLYLELGKFDDAIMAAQKVIDLQPGNYRAWGLKYQSLAKKSEGASGAAATKLVKEATEAFQMFEELKKQQSGSE